MQEDQKQLRIVLQEILFHSKLNEIVVRGPFEFVFNVINIWTLHAPLRRPNDVVSGFRYWTLDVRLSILKKAVKDVVETSPIPVAIFVYVSRGWQPCLAPRDVILRHSRVYLTTAAAAILFSTFELREVILRHSHVYLT